MYEFSLKWQTAMQLKRVPNRFFGIQDFPYLNLWIRDSGLKVRAGGAMPKITLGITGLHKILEPYHRTEEPYWIYWGRSLNCEKRKRLHKKTGTGTTGMVWDTSMTAV